MLDREDNWLTDAEQVEEDYEVDRLRHHDHLLARAEQHVTDAFLADVADAFNPWDDEEHAKTVTCVIAWIRFKGIDVQHGVGFSDDAPAMLEDRIEFWDGERPTVFFPHRVYTYEAEQNAAWAFCSVALHLGMSPKAVLAEATKPRHPLELLGMGAADDSD